jgi:hypothetical protein
MQLGKRGRSVSPIPDRSLWLGGAYTDDRTGSFSHCSAGVVYDGGINLFVVSTEAHGWWLGFTSPNWSITPSASIPVKLQFDGRAPVEVLGTIADGQLLLVRAPDESHLIDTFQRSSRIAVTAQEKSFSLGLAVTSGVLSELANCVRNSIALETRPANTPPPAAAATPPQSPPQIPRPLVARDVTEFEEIKLAQNFLLAAGLPDAHLIDTGKPAALASFTAVWRSDDAAGGGQDHISWPRCYRREYCFRPHFRRSEVVQGKFRRGPVERGRRRRRRL